MRVGSVSVRYGKNGVMGQPKIRSIRNTVRVVRSSEEEVIPIYVS